MLKHRVRNLAVAGFMIASALVLTVPFAPSASASTPATCVTSDHPWPCIEVFGNGLYVQDMNGWAHNADTMTIYNLHMELYWAAHNEPPLYGHYIKNSGEFNLAGGHNSSNVSYGPVTWSGPRYLCNAVWQDNFGYHTDLGYVCVYIS